MDTLRSSGFVDRIIKEAIQGQAVAVDVLQDLMLCSVKVMNDAMAADIFSFLEAMLHGASNSRSFVSAVQALSKLSPEVRHSVNTCVFYYYMTPLIIDMYYVKKNVLGSSFVSAVQALSKLSPEVRLSVNTCAFV